MKDESSDSVLDGAEIPTSEDLDAVESGLVKPQDGDEATKNRLQLERCLFYIAAGKSDSEIAESTKKRGYAMTEEFVKSVRSRIEDGEFVEDYAKAKQRFRDSCKIFPFAERHARLGLLHEILAELKDKRTKASGFTTRPGVFVDIVRQERSTLKDIQKESANEDVLDALMTVTSGDYARQKEKLVAMMREAIQKGVVTIGELSAP